MSEPVQPAESGRATARLIFTSILLFGLGTVWVFPHLWYEKPNAQGIWFVENREIQGWEYRERPISEAAEQILTADETTNGEFINDQGQLVRVFISNRFDEIDDLSLFSHPPDLCWTNVGFQMLSVGPGIKKVVVHEIAIPFERRIFQKESHRELVYYAGMLAGKPLSFRLGRGALPPVDPTEMQELPRLQSLNRITEAFRKRQTLAGKKQFLRISTPISSRNEPEADALLQRVAQEWLRPGELKLEKR